MLAQVSIDPGTALDGAASQGPIVYLVVVAIFVAASFKIVSMIYLEFPEHKRRMKYYDRVENMVGVILGMVKRQAKDDQRASVRAARSNKILDRQTEFNASLASIAGKVNAHFPELNIGEDVGRMRAAVHDTRDLPDTSHLMDAIDD